MRGQGDVLVKVEGRGERDVRRRVGVKEVVR